MKKAVKIVSKIVLIICILALIILILANLIPIVRILFFGMNVGSDYPDTIWWEKMTLKGFNGVKMFYKAWGDLVLMMELPIAIICIVYIIVYFKVIKKNLNK